MKLAVNMSKTRMQRSSKSYLHSILRCVMAFNQQIVDSADGKQYQPT